MITLLREVRISGNTLMKNHECEVVVRPAQTGEIRIYSEGAEQYFVATYQKNVISDQTPVIKLAPEHFTPDGKLYLVELLFS